MESLTEQCARVRRSATAAAPRSNAPRGIPVPPYDKELPKEYWEGLRKQGLQDYWDKQPPPPKKHSVARWCFVLGALLLLAALALIPHPVQKPSSTTTTAAADHGFAPGQSYWVHMPDNRNIVINYKGTVASVAALPPQTGINNAAYIDRSTGAMWIWTVPATGPNVATWIDP